MKRLLWLSDSCFTNTGYSTISRYILNGLAARGWDCHLAAHNYLGQSLPPGITFKDGYKLNFWIHGRGREDYHKDLLQEHFQHLQPNVFGILLDTFMLYPWFLNVPLTVRSLFYYPSDGEHFPIGCDNILRHVHKAVAMSKYAQNQVLEHGVQAAYIPHAIDHTNYYPLSKDEQAQIKKTLLVKTLHGVPVYGALDGKYVVGVVARNQGRKMLDRTITAFAEFCRDKPDAILLLHTDPYDVAAPYDLRDLILRHKIENRVCFTGINFYQNYELKDMNRLYNAMDVFFLSTSGEGFGVPTVEAMACAVPVVVTDYTTTKELVAEEPQCGLAVPLSTEIVGTWNVNRAVMNTSAAAQALTTLYHDRARAQKLGSNGRKKVLERYTWEKIIPEWDALLTEMMIS